MDSKQLKARTKAFSLSIIFLLSKLPKTDAGKVISYQLIKSSTSVGANYRVACRAKSKADFIYKINIVEEEADESLYWLEILNEAKLLKSEILEPLVKEADELTAIFTAIGKTSKSNK